MALTINQVRIVLTTGAIIISANCYDALHRLWKNFSAEFKLQSELHTNVFDALHKLKREILQIQAIHPEPQRVEIKQKIEFALARIGDFANFILRHRTAENSRDIALVNLKITSEAVYLRNLLSKLT